MSNEGFFDDQPNREATVSYQAPLTPMGVLRRRYPLLIVLGLIGAGLGYLYSMRQPPLYQASSKLLVQRQQSGLPLEVLNIGLNAAQSQDQMLTTHMALIKSPLIIDAAAKDPSVVDLPTMRGVSDRVGSISGALNTLRPKMKDGSVVPNMLELTYTSGSPTDAERIMTAVIRAYQEYLRNSETRVSKQMIDLITKAKEELDTGLESLQKKYNEFVQKNKLVLRGPNGSLLSLERESLTDVERKLRLIEQQRAETQVRLETLRTIRQDPKMADAVDLLIGRSSQNSGDPDHPVQGTVEQRILDEKMIENELLQKFGPDHPVIKSVRQKIKALEEFESSKRLASRTLRKPTVDYGESYLKSLEIETQLFSRQEKLLREMAEKQRPEVEKNAALELQDQNQRDVIAQRKQLFDATLRRLEELRLIREDTGVKAEILAPPLVTETFIGLMRSMGFGGVAGLFLGAVLGYLVELADKCFRSPEEIRSTLGVPVVSHIPFLVEAKETRRSRDGAASPLAGSLVTHHAPRSRASESYRAVRTSIYFHTRGANHRLIQVTSPDPSDGKTTLSSNLAVVVAQSGKRTLLIDADLRRPRIHKMFGLEREPGVSSLIDGSKPFEECVRPVEGVDGLWVMTAGSRISNPAEVLTSPKFEELLAKAREEFDFVIIDTPPVLVVTDAAVVAARVDGVLMALRMHRYARPQAANAMEQLAAVGCSMLGVVVNGVGVGTAYGGYSSKTYRYDYNSGYKYNGYGARKYYGPDVETNGRTKAPPVARLDGGK